MSITIKRVDKTDADGKLIMKIEDALKGLKEEMTIILVTNLVQQARRLASRTAFFLMGEFC